MKRRSSQHKAIRTFAEDAHSIVLPCVLFVFQRLISFLLFTHVYICLSVFVSVACRSQKRASGPQNWRSRWWWITAWVLRSELRPSASTAKPSNLWAVFPAPTLFSEGRVSSSIPQSRVALCSHSPCLSLAGSADNVMAASYALTQSCVLEGHGPLRGSGPGCPTSLPTTDIPERHGTMIPTPNTPE